MLSEELVDIATRHQVYLERLKAGEIKRSNVLFALLNIELTRILSRIDIDDLSQLSITARAKLIEDIRKGHLEAYTAHMKTLIDTLRGLSSFAHEFELEALNEVTIDEVEVISTVPDDDTEGGLWAWVQGHAMSATGKLLAGWLGAWAGHEVTRATDITRRAITESWTTRQLTTAFRGTKANGYGDGLHASAKRNTAAATNTAIQHVDTAARARTMEGAAVQPKNAGIKTDAEGRVTSIPARTRKAADAAGIKVGTKVNLLGYRWVSILDSKTSQICRSLDGQVFAFGQGPLPPAHVNCRSTIIAEMRGRWLKREPTGRFAKRDERTSASGPVDGGVTYYEWLKTQPDAFQDDALGKARAALFRKGGMSAETFAKLNLGRNFQPLTLDQMRKLKPNAFRRAGL